jgi:hypothetical protein
MNVFDAVFGRFVDAFSTAILDAFCILDAFLPDVLLHCAPTMRLFLVVLETSRSSGPARNVSVV